MYSVKTLISSRFMQVPYTPGVYCWWFDEDAYNKLISRLQSSKFIEKSKIQERIIDDKKYYALYFGIALNLKQRLSWHISQKHTPSSVKSGYLSTLRQTLSSILGWDQTKAETALNDFLNKHAYVTLHETVNKVEAENIESHKLSHEYYLLNLQKNKSVHKEILKEISALRKIHKK